jgi:hypothetical protein
MERSTEDEHDDVFNRHSWLEPTGILACRPVRLNDISAPGFGSENSTVNNPRVVQFGLKLTF